MKMEVTKITLQNYKGVANKEITFNGNTLIKGQNGSGKSTIGSSILWVFCDCDLDLNKNPLVTPIGASECTTKVEIEMNIDGKPVTVAKIQKFKSKVDDNGKVTSSTTNSYEINSIDKIQRDFISDLESRGIDTDKFLIYANPSAFTADTSKKGREEMREVLFSMADDVKDSDIAKELKFDDITALLEEKGLRLDEIEAQAKSTIRKIVENNGKNNELIDARISGIIESKSSADVKELEKQKKDYEKELSDLQESIKDMSKADNSLRDKIAILKNEQAEYKVKANEERSEQEIELNTKLVQLETEKAVELSKYNISGKEISDIEAKIDSLNESLKEYRDLYKRVQNEVFDENDTKCPTCGRVYEKERVDEIMADFEKSKTNRLNTYKSKAEEIKVEIKSQEELFKASKKQHEKSHKAIENVDKKMDDVNKQLNGLFVIDFSIDEKYNKFSENIKELEVELAKSNDLKLQELSNRENYLQQMIRQLIGELAIADKNKELDERIVELRKTKKNGEIAKAKAERIMDHVSQIRKSKDDRLCESINSHFSLVEWHLWEYQKNGEPRPICEPYIDGKPMSTSANGSLKTLAKVSISADIQKYDGVVYPIVIEDYSLFSKNTISRVNVGESQLIGLVVSEDKGVKIENA